MTTQEFSDQFDVLYNNVTSNQAPGLDEYEKSVFLTKAQDEILKAYFNPKSNKTMDGFDGNEKRQIDFSMVMRVTSYTPTGKTLLFKSEKQAKRCNISSDIMMFINEFVDVTRSGNEIRLAVIPIDYNELSRLSMKPYKRPNHYQAWRIIDNSSGTNAVELQVGPNDTISKYTIRYIKRPNPIILEDLDGVSINDSTAKSKCELDPILHEEILQRAVELAKAAYQGDIGTTVQMGSASATALGFVGGGGVPQRGER